MWFTVASFRHEANFPNGFDGAVRAIVSRLIIALPFKANAVWSEKGGRLLCAKAVVG